MWILDRGWRDIVFFYSFPLLFCVLYWFEIPHGTLALILFYLVVVLIDSGHVYTTIWRTYALREERTRYKMYWIVPFAVFFGSLAWLSSGLGYFWAMVLYFTYFHHLRQIQGVFKWYMKLNGRFRKMGVYLLYALMLVPFTYFHLREEVPLQIYNHNDIFFFPSPDLRPWGLALIGLIWLFWLGWEATLFIRERKFEHNRFLSILVPAVIHIFCFVIAIRAEQVLFPLLALHGVTYMAIMAKSMQKLRSRFFTGFFKSLLVVFALGATLSTLEALGVRDIINTDDSYIRATDWTEFLLLAVFVTPLLTHYILDAYIWKKGHPGFEKILELSPEGKA